MRILLTTASLAAALTTAPAIAEETMGTATGKVEEILIKVETPEGPRWYKLGADISKIDVREGKAIRFDYADDTIEAIEVEEDESSE